jgi:plastocyanin
LKTVGLFWLTGRAARGRVSRGSFLLAFLFGTVGVIYPVPVASGVVSGRVTEWRLQPGGADPAAVWLESDRAKPAPKNYLVMAQHDGRFVPPFLVAAVGQTIEMPNLDQVAHNVYSVTPSHTFNLGLYAMGERKEVIFDRPGLVEVACSIHSFMRARILVVPNALYATVDGDGSYQILNVPAGNYTLRFWAGGRAPFSREITVAPGGRVRVDITEGVEGR